MYSCQEVLGCVRTFHMLARAAAGLSQDSPYRITMCAGGCADSGRGMTLTELQTLVTAQSSVPVTETAFKDALRELNDTVTVNWTNQTVQARQVEQS